MSPHSWANTPAPATDLQLQFSHIYHCLIQIYFRPWNKVRLCKFLWTIDLNGQAIQRPTERRTLRRVFWSKTQLLGQRYGESCGYREWSLFPLRQEHRMSLVCYMDQESFCAPALYSPLQTGCTLDVCYMFGGLCAIISPKEVNGNEEYIRLHSSPTEP